MRAHTSLHIARDHTAAAQLKLKASQANNRETIDYLLTIQLRDSTKLLPGEL